MLYIELRRKIISMDSLPSPYLDGTFDEFYQKYSSEFSGLFGKLIVAVLTDVPFARGGICLQKIREKPMEQVKREIEWIGKNKVKYIAMSDSNFGIRERDIELTEMLAACKRKYSVQISFQLVGQKIHLIKY